MIFRKEGRDPGRDFELEFFGFSAQYTGIPPVFSIERCIKIAKASQPAGWNPAAPETGYARIMFHEVKSRLRVLTKRKFKLRLYLSLGTSLDYWHGVDAFFEASNKRATLDVTTALKPPERRKADIIIVSRRLGADWDKHVALAVGMLSGLTSEEVSQQVENGAETDLLHRMTVKSVVNQPLSWNPADPDVFRYKEIFSNVKTFLPPRLRPDLKLYLATHELASLGVEAFFVLGDQISTFKILDQGQIAETNSVLHVAVRKPATFLEWLHECWSLALRLSKPQYREYIISRCPVKQ